MEFVLVLLLELVLVLVFEPFPNQMLARRNVSWFCSVEGDEAEEERGDL